MKHHPQAENENFDYVYYWVALLSFLFTGYIIGLTPVWILVTGVIGLINAAIFVNVLAKSSEEA